MLVAHRHMERLMQAKELFFDVVKVQRENDAEPQLEVCAGMSTPTEI